MPDEVADAHAGDSPQFPKLVAKTAQNFTMRQVSADKAYSSGNNMKAAIENHAMTYRAFRTNAKGTAGSDLF